MRCDDSDVVDDRRKRREYSRYLSLDTKGVVDGQHGRQWMTISGTGARRREGRDEGGGIRGTLAMQALFVAS